MICEAQQNTSAHIQKRISRSLKRYQDQSLTDEGCADCWCSFHYSSFSNWFILFGLRLNESPLHSYDKEICIFSYTDYGENHLEIKWFTKGIQTKNVLPFTLYRKVTVTSKDANALKPHETFFIFFTRLWNLLFIRLHNLPEDGDGTLGPVCITNNTWEFHERSRSTLYAAY